MNKYIILRPERAEDQEFLFAVYASTRAEELQRVPWPDSQKQDFLRMQFNLQTKHYHQHYPDAAYQIVLMREEPIGRLYIHSAKDHIHLMDIALLSEYRRAGIGGQLMKNLLLEAAAARKPVRVHVEWENPALRLYTRLGFRLLENRGVYYFMEWKAESEPEPEPEVSRPAP
jgi:ribosomal protein S18 acetylase RimI-like enzyme